MTGEANNFKKLIKEYGPKKAIEIIRTTSKPLSGDFAKEHKNLDAFSNNTTNEITQQLDDEKEMETGTSNIVQLQIPLSTFSTTQNHTIEYAQETIDA